MPRSFKFLIIFLLGISSGLPLLAFQSLLQARLKDSGVDLSTIGYFGWTTLPYSWKLLWAPLLDRYAIPGLGRRRGWIILSQIGLVISFLLVGSISPSEHLFLLAIITGIGIFFSATQDIVFDGFRREIFSDDETGLASSLAVTGYRVGMILAGGVAMSFSQDLPWYLVYGFLASCIGVCIVVTFFAPEPEVEVKERKTFAKSFVEPFLAYLTHPLAIRFLAFALLYKLGDIISDTLRVPFLIEMGWSKKEIGEYVKTFGLFSAILGGLAGGALMLKIGMRASLIWFGFLQAVSLAGFMLLVDGNHNVGLLAFVIAFENFAAGMGTSAYVAYLTSTCDKRYSATQYAALTSVMRFPTLLITTPSGDIVKMIGWGNFFLFSVIAAIPGLLLVMFFLPINTQPAGDRGSSKDTT